MDRAWLTVALAAFALGISSADSPAPGPFQGQSKSTPKPVILIYWEPGMTTEFMEEELEVAIWESGRVIWRDPPPAWKRTGSKWGMAPGKFYEAQIGSKAVADVLASLRKAKVMNAKGWVNYPPDASCTHVLVRLGKDKLELRSATNDPEVRAPGRWPEPLWTNGRNAWLLIRKLSRGLIPGKGKEIPLPKVSSWDAG
jgi:hypothetical protein